MRFGLLLLVPVFVACTTEPEMQTPTPPADAGMMMTEMDAGTQPECTSNAECGGQTPYCDDTGSCAPLPPGHAIGYGDGSPTSVTLEKIHTAYPPKQATDLEFNPARPNELWVLHREFSSDAPCDSNNRTAAGCLSLEGSVTIIYDPASDARTTEAKRDENAWHFMRRPPALAFGVDGLFATCGEERTGNFLDETADFIGPTLWDSDPAVFAITPPGLNGSHLDMLHASPWCTGVAHEADNIYWVVNGDVGSLDRYDFKADHGPGNADHSDGEVYRYGIGTVTRVPEVPGHIVYRDGFVYIADTGTGRILKLDTQTGTEAGPVQPVFEPFAATATYDGVEVTELVPAGTLERPSGIEIHEDILYVTDNAQSRFYAFDLEGNLLRTLDTGLPPGSLAGLAVSPDGVIYFVDLMTADVYRLLP